MSNLNGISLNKPKKTLYLEDFYITYRRSQLAHLKSPGNQPPSDLIPQKRTKVEENGFANLNLVKEEVHSPLKFTCTHCTYATRRKDGLTRHLYLIHDEIAPNFSPKVYACHECDYTTKLSYSLTSHLLVHETAESSYKFACDACPYRAKDKRSLFKHALTHKPLDDTEFNCDSCNFRTRRRSSLANHTKSSSDESTDDDYDPKSRMYKCELCNFAAKARKCLKSHAAVHKTGDDKRFKCPHCHYTNDKKKKLQRHLSVHSNSDETFKYRCPECPFRTKWADALTSHKLRHIKHEPGSYEARGCHRCPNCTYNARNKAHLTRHLRLHNLL